MFENQPGIYTGSYAAPVGVYVENAVVKAQLTDAVGNITTKYVGEVTLDTESRIDSVSVLGSPAKANEIITVTLVGEASGTAQFVIDGVVDDVTMTENPTQPGVYTGLYTVTTDDLTVTDAVVTVTLIDSIGNVATDSSQRVTIDPAAPELTSISTSGSPAKAGEKIEIIVIGEPGVSAQFSIIGVAEDIPMEETQPGMYTGTYTVVEGVNTTDAILEVTLTDPVGNVIKDSSQSVSIDTAGPGITSVSIFGSPAKIDEEISITATGESGASAKFSIAGVAEDITMVETWNTVSLQAGTYMGTYTVTEGVNVNDAIVTVTLTDSVGNISIDANQLVTIDTTIPEINSVSVTGSPARIDETISVTVIGEAGANAHFSITDAAENLVMTEESDQPGTYTGTYTVTDDTICVQDVALIVTLEDIAGNLGSDSSQKVSICAIWDVNADGVVDTVDLAVIGTYYGKSAEEGNGADVNSDGYVDILDLILVCKHFTGSTDVASPGRNPVKANSEYLPILSKLYEEIKDSQNEDIAIVKKLLLQLIGLPEIQITRSQLMQNYPNPCNPETWIPYNLANPGSVVIKIYSASGQLIRILDLGYKDSGSYSDRIKAAHWDGVNESGETVSSGLYFYVINCGDFSSVRKMIVSR